MRQVQISAIDIFINIFSIVHCWFICSLILYLQFNPALCQEGWSKFSQIWIGFLWTDLFVGLLTKTAGFGKNYWPFLKN
jgi:hypothetical protein